MTCNNNIVDKSRERWEASDEEGHDCAPVASELWRVAVDTVEVVHVWDRYVSAPDDIVVDDQNRCHGTKKNGVATEECNELCGRRKDFPLQVCQYDGYQILQKGIVLTGTNAQEPMTAASSWPRRILMYFGAKDMRSLAALIEFAEMLMPSVTMIRPIAAKAAAARPPCEPESIHLWMMSMGFHMTSPYAV